jgi:hypothetical protein
MCNAAFPPHQEASDFAKFSAAQSSSKFTVVMPNPWPSNTTNVSDTRAKVKPASNNKYCRMVGESRDQLSSGAGASGRGATRGSFTSHHSNNTPIDPGAAEQAIT